MPVSIVKLKDVDKGIDELLTSLEYSPITDRVLIKPNLVVPASPGSGVITDPKVARSLIRWLRDRGVREVVIGESPALTADVQECFRKCGYERLAREEGVELVDLDKAERTEIDWKFGKIDLPKLIFSHSYINLAKLKTHVQTTVSLGLKNQKGLLLAKDKKKFHKLGLHEPISELSRVVKPELTIIDGLVCMEGDGPIWGKSRRLDVLVGGGDPVEVDLACLKIMGIPPEEVEHLAPFLAEGRKPPEVIGVQIERSATGFVRPDMVSKKLLRLVSWRSPDACTMCTYNTDIALRRVAKNPKYAAKLVRLLWWTFFGGLNLVFGKKSQIGRAKGRVLLIGDCARLPYDSIAMTKVKGCPPDVEDIIDSL